MGVVSTWKVYFRHDGSCSSRELDRVAFYKLFVSVFMCSITPLYKAINLVILDTVCAALNSPMCFLLDNCSSLWETDRGFACIIIGISAWNVLRRLQEKHENTCIINNAQHIYTK